MFEIEPLISKIEQSSEEDRERIIQQLIFEAEKNMIASDNQIEIPQTDHFSKGVYAREIRVPKGAFVVGKIHKFENLNILSQGEMTVFSIEGIKRVKAPVTVVSPAGVKRLAFAHEDCVWTTIHGTKERNVEKIEKKFIAKSYNEVKKLSFKDKFILRWCKWLG